MKKILIKLIPIKKLRKALRKKYLQQENFKCFGTENELQINKNIKGYIYGNNNKVIIKSSPFHVDIHVFIGLPDLPINNCIISIGKDFSCNGCVVRICENDTVCEIGDNCMFSDDIYFWVSDTHTIVNKNKQCINTGKYIKIGNHVWLGHGVSVLKNTIIADNCVAGTKAVVGGVFDKTNSIIAGNPGKIVKTDIDWDRRRPQQYILDSKEK